MLNPKFVENLIVEMANSKLEVDIVMKSRAEKVWKNLKEFAKVFPKALPDTYESIEIVQGDGISVGSVLKATYKPGTLSTSHD